MFIFPNITAAFLSRRNSQRMQLSTNIKIVQKSVKKIKKTEVKKTFVQWINSNKI